MIYKVDNIDIKDLGLIPVKAGESIALSGVFSFPSREGETERNWGTSVEPFLDGEETRFAGRTLGLSVLLKIERGEDYNARLNDVLTAFKRCRKLGASFGEFDVIVKGKINVIEYRDRLSALIKVPFWQEKVALGKVSFTGTNPSGMYRIDDTGLKNDLGIHVKSCLDGGSVGERLDVKTTLPYSRSEFRDPGTVTLKCLMTGAGLDELSLNMGRLHSLLATPGARVLGFPGGRTREFYVKEGFEVKVTTRKTMEFDLKCRMI